MPVHWIHPGVRTGGRGGADAHDSRDARIVVVGRLQRWKRLELALEAMRLVLADSRGRACGSWVKRARISTPTIPMSCTRALALGIGDAVEFVGAVPVVDQQLAGADVVLHVADRESFGVVLIEALLRGIPVVTPPLGGGAEIIRDGVDGLLVDPTDSPALARACLADRRPSAAKCDGRGRPSPCFRALR